MFFFSDLNRRQVLDEDNRDVKLLQEMLLDDGELHGAGRQRQFRWRSLGIYNNCFYHGWGLKLECLVLRFMYS